MDIDQYLHRAIIDFFQYYNTNPGSYYYHKNKSMSMSSINMKITFATTLPEIRSWKDTLMC
jgi:hypothetical protein